MNFRFTPLIFWQIIKNLYLFFSASKRLALLLSKLILWPFLQRIAADSALSGSPNQAYSSLWEPGGDGSFRIREWHFRHGAVKQQPPLKRELLGKMGSTQRGWHNFSDYQTNVGKGSLQFSVQTVSRLRLNQKFCKHDVTVKSLVLLANRLSRLLFMTSYVIVLPATYV